MNSININKETVNALDPNDIIVVTCISSDTLAQTGTEIIESATDDGEMVNPTLYEAIEWWLTDISGNRWEIIVLLNGKMQKCRIID